MPFPTNLQVLAKSSKMIPVMLMGTVLHGKRYSLLEYACCLAISGGRAQAGAWAVAQLHMAGGMSQVHTWRPACPQERTNTWCYCRPSQHALSNTVLDTSFLLHLRASQRAWACSA